MSELSPRRFHAAALHSAAVLVLLLPCAAVAQHQGGAPPAPPREYKTAPVGVAGAEAWRNDLRTLADALERIHPEPYAHTSKARFDSAVALLNDSMPLLPEHRIIVGFAQLLALVGDGHTSLPLYFARGVDFHVLPYRLGVYEDGVFVEAADRAYADMVGGRIVAIGGVPVDEALRRAAPLISRDNDNWIAAVAPNLLNRIEVLHALGLTRDLASAELTVRVGDRTLDRTLRPLPDAPRDAFGLPFLPRFTSSWVDARDAATAPVPRYQQRFDDIYWWEWVPEQDLLYIKWDQVQNRVDGPTALAVFREALTFARAQRPARTVIDIRNNTGGEGGLVPAVIREIVRTREIDEPGRLFVVIGRRTFSAGQMMTAMLQRFSSAIVVGEPSSAFYNGYAGHEFVHLPNSGIGVMISPDYYQMGDYPGDMRQQATPRLAAVPTFADYRANRDPALDAILAWEPDRLLHDLTALLGAGDTAGAAELIRSYDARPVNRYRDASTDVNGLGYRVLREGRLAEALAIFELNVRVHPQYTNGWDSLGEAYVQVDRRDDAIAAFRRALAIDPDFPPSREWLRRLGAGR